MNRVQNKQTVFILVGELTRNSFNDELNKKMNECLKNESLDEIKQNLAEMDYDVEILPTDLANYNQNLDKVQKVKNSLVVNLCDGVEIDGYPGLSVVKELEKRKIAYTGGNPEFFLNTTSKIQQKNIMLQDKVNTLPFVEIRKDFIEEDIQTAEETIGFPMIVKPSVSYSSYLITLKSVVKNKEEAYEQVRIVLNNTLGAEGVFVEKFLVGKEYTSFVLGEESSGSVLVESVERSFNPKYFQDDLKKFFYTEFYYGEENVKDISEQKYEDQYYYHLVPSPEIAQKIAKLSLEAYKSLKGNGYARIDIRSDESGNLFILEVNANCGISFSDHSSSVGSILHAKNISATQVLSQMIRTAQIRSNLL